MFKHYSHACKNNKKRASGPFGALSYFTVCLGSKHWPFTYVPGNTTASYLDPCLAEPGPLRQLLPGIDVRVLCALEGALQLLDLFGREGGAAPTLFPLQRDPGLTVHVAVVVLLRKIYSESL